MVDELAARIRSARTEAGMSREQVAAKVGVSLATVIRLESGRTKNISVARLTAIAEATNQPLTYFLNGEVAA